MSVIDYIKIRSNSYEENKDNRKDKYSFRYSLFFIKGCHFWAYGINYSSGRVPKTSGIFSMKIYYFFMLSHKANNKKNRKFGA